MDSHSPLPSGENTHEEGASESLSSTQDLASPDLASGSPFSAIPRRTFLQGAAAVGVVSGLTNVSHAAEAVSNILDAPPAPASAVAEMDVTLKVNGVDHAMKLDPRVTVLDALRERLDMTGTKKGCDHGQCGACTVLIDGRRVNSCLTLAMSADGLPITTVEGLANGEELHPIQRAFIEHDGFQCGYCTPGQIMSMRAMGDEVAAGQASAATPDLTKMGPVALTEDEIRERMSGNLCRCGAYNGIVDAAQDVYAEMIPAADREEATK